MWYPYTAEYYSAKKHKTCGEMDGARNNHPELGIPDLVRQTLLVFMDDSF